MANSSNILITHDLDGAALAAPVDAARRNGATYKTRTIDDLRIKDDRLRAAIDGTGHLLFDVQSETRGVRM